MSLGHWLPSLLVIAYAILRCCAERFPSRNGLVAVPPNEVTKPANYLPPHTRHGHQETLNIIDTVLLASVDGRFHAFNRTNGQQIWSMASTPGLNDILPPLVRTEHDLDRGDDDDDEPREVYIVEPQTGDIFILNQDATRETPLRKLPYSIPQLVELSPFSFNDPSDPNDPPRTFVGKKETSIITLDLTTGAVLGTTTHTLERCRKGGHGDVDDYPEEDDDFEDTTLHQAKPVEVQIGRTEYQINVMSKTSLLQTLAFTVYGPNNVDRDRQMNWDHTPDDVYVQPGWEGTTYAFASHRELPLWICRVPEPVVAVFDVVTSSSNANAETHPVLLLQPRPRLQDLFPTKYQKLTGIEDRTVVGRIGNSLFAMGNVNFPLVNIAQLPDTPSSSDPEKDKGEHNTLSTATRCRDLFCFLGVRLTKRDDASSRLSRLLDSPEQSHFKAMDKRDEGPRGEDAQERIGGNPTASKVVVVYPTHPPSPSRQLLGEPAPSSLNASASVVANQPQFPPTDATAHNWTLLIPFIGGFIAVWLLLRKFIRISDHVPKRFRERGLIQPLQRDNPRTQLLPPPLPQDASGIIEVESEPKELPVPPAYSVDAGPGQPIASSSRVRIEDLPMLSEKFGVIEEVPMQVVSGPRAAAPTVAPADEGGEEEEEEEDDAKPGGKKKKVRRKRGKKKNPQQANANLNASRPVDEIADDYVRVARPPIPTTPITSEPPPIANMSLPMPVTHTPVSLIVTSNILGWGSHGTIVFEGSLQGRAVAVKRLQQEFVTVASREVAILQESDDHPNVIRYFYQERKDNFLYIALELCPASLADIIERPDAFKEIQAAFDAKRALQQITSGLKHLHSLKIVHRDIKPQNILVSKAQRNGGHRVMISDFGLCKKLELDQTSFLPTTVMGGSVGWRAPEILRGDVKLDEAAVAEGGSGSGSSSNPPTIGPSNTGSNPGGTRLTKSVDIFALGCSFYYTLTSGDHPFGDKFEREVNILKGAVSLDGLEGMGEEGAEAVDLIRRMLAQEPKDRPDTSACLLHPFFWTPGRRLMFLQDASDRFEIMERDPKELGLVALETNATKVIGPDWHKRLDRVFIDNLGKYRKYDGSSVQDLLRALRNKKHHYQDLPDNVKRHLGPLPEGFLSYFTRRFPGLFLHVHSTISNLPLRHEAMFRTYFQLEDS